MVAAHGLHHAWGGLKGGGMAIGVAVRGRAEVSGMLGCSRLMVMDLLATRSNQLDLRSGSLAAISALADA